MRRMAMAGAAAAVLGAAAIPLLAQRGGGAPAADRVDGASAGARTEAAVGADARAAGAQPDFRWSGRIARGDEIEIRHVVGDVRAEPSSGDQVEVIATGALDRVRVEVVEREGGVTICTVYDDRDQVRDRDRDRDRDQDADADGRRGRARGDDEDDGRCGSHRVRLGHDDDRDRDEEDLTVDFVVRVPAGVRFHGATVAGDVEARGLRSPVKANTVAGRVRVSTTEEAEAASVSGDVEVTMGRMPAGDLKFATVSGDVDVRIPAGADADLEARTLTGEIETDFPVEDGPMEQVGGRDAPLGIDIRIGRRAEGRIGRGGRTLEVTTVSGDIRVRRGS